MRLRDRVEQLALGWKDVFVSFGISVCVTTQLIWIVLRMPTYVGPVKEADGFFLPRNNTPVS